MINLLVEINKHFPLGDCSILDGRETDIVVSFGFTFSQEEQYYGTYADGLNVDFEDVSESFRETILNYMEGVGVEELETVIVPSYPHWGEREELQGHFIIDHGRLLLNLCEVYYDGKGSGRLKTYHTLLVAMVGVEVEN